MIDFAHPWMLVGLLAAAIPLLLHLLGRRRARKVPFTALAFLMNRNPRRARAIHLRERSLLAVRCAAAALIALALAKPLVPALDDDDSVIAGAGPVALAIVLDDSMSMMTRGADGETRFEAARARVLRLLDRLPIGSTAALVASGHPARALTRRLSGDLRSVAQATRKIVHHPRRDDAARALAMAEQLLSTASDRARGLVVLSDLQASGWAGVELPVEPPAKGRERPPLRLQLERVGDAKATNTAITDVRAEPAPERGPQQVRVEATVSHHGARSFRGHLTVRAGEREVKSWIEVAGGETIKRSMVLPATTDTAEVSLPADDLAADNRRVVRLSGGDVIRVALVDGAPRPVPREDEIFFAQRALQIGADRAGALAVDVLQPGQLSADKLAAFDVIILANVGELPPLLERELAELVERGTGLLITAGDAVPEQPEGWMGRLLPFEVVGHRRLASPKPGRRPATDDARTRLELVDPAEDPAPTRQVAALRSRLVDAVEALAGARIRHHLLVRPSATLGSHVVLRTSNGAPTLLMAARGAGLVALLTTAIDRDWSDLPLQPGYLPLLQEVAAALAGRTGEGRQAAIEPGAVAVLARHKEAERLVVQRAADEQADAPVREIGASEQGGRSWQVDGLLVPGRYLAREEGKGGRWSERSILVVPPAAESELKRLDERVLLPPEPETPAQPTRPKVPGWSFALVGLLALLIIEGALLVRSGAPA